MSSKTIIIGVTGGIGSGKSMVCNMFAELGVPIFNTDNVANNITNTNNDVKNQIIILLGNNAYNTDGSMNRKYVASKVFSDSNLLKSLNAIIHPLVYLEFYKWIDSINTNYAMIESALLFKSKLINDIDHILVITANDEVRIKRVMNRSNMTREDVINRMNNQMDTSYYKIDPYYIKNEGTIEELQSEVLRLHRMFKHFEMRGY